MDLSEQQSESSEESHDTSHDEDDQTNGISTEFRNEISLSEQSDSVSDSDSLSDSELNPFHSTIYTKNDDIDSFVTFEALSVSGRGHSHHQGTLGDLESQVMNTSLPRFRP